MTAEAVSGRAYWLRAAGYLVSALSLLFAWTTLGAMPEDIRIVAGSMQSRWVVTACLLFLAHGIINALAYGLLVKSFEPARGVAIGASAWSLSVLSKYVPGGVWMVVGRGVLLSADGVRTATILGSSLLEQLISLGACVLVASMFFAMSHGVEPIQLVLAATAFVLAGSLITLRLGHRFAIESRRVYLGSSVLYGVALLPYALGYWLVVSPVDSIDFLLRLFSGTVAGVLALVVPGGLGVREAWVSVQSGAQGGGVLAAMLFARLLIFGSECILLVGATGFRVFIRSMR